MSNEVQGAAELKKALADLADLKASEWQSALKAAVRTPMMSVRKRALARLSKISPGKTPLHRTYMGRLVSAGFAYRSVALKVSLNIKRGTATAILGVKREAFYVLSFFELGSAKTGRHPWLTPSLEESKDEVVSKMGAAMRKRIEQIARRRASAGGKK